MSASMNRWFEVDKAIDENRHELVLSGEAVSTRIADSVGLDERIWSISKLNFLEISKTCLRILPDHVGKLENLLNLVIRGNKLETLPAAAGQLKKLKLLDISNNELTSLPVEIGSLKELQTVNVSCNKLAEFIDVSGMAQLHILDVSHNVLTELPPGVTAPELCHLSSVVANNNQIGQLPSDFSELPSLKLLDLSNNKIESLPAELSECEKLKEMKVVGNPIKDRRLLKMVDGCSTKSVLDYLRNVLEKEKKTKGTKDDKKDKKKKGGKGKDAAAAEEPLQNLIRVLHFKADDGGLNVQVTAEAQTVRPYIVCCIVRNLNFAKSKSMMKRFILSQTKLHDGICAKRQAATIATHDLDAVKSPLKYDARPPDELKILPLMKRKEVSATVLVGRLRHEAEELRKEKKRNTLSGIHKYLDLLKGNKLYPCLVDSSDVVISFPPIINSDVTKVSQKTTHILVEVTSSQNLDVCKKVMEEFLTLLLQMGIGQAEAPAPPPPTNSVLAIFSSGDDGSEGNDDEDKGAVAEAKAAEDECDEDAEPALNSEQILVVEQVKVVDHLGNLKVLYPSRVDLQLKDCKVTRDYE